MGDKKENIDKLFSSGLSGFEAETPYDGWEAINARIVKSKQKRRALFLRWTLIFGALLLAFFAGFQLKDWNFLNTTNPNINGNENSKPISTKGKTNNVEEEFTLDSLQGASSTSQPLIVNSPETNQNQRTGDEAKNPIKATSPNTFSQKKEANSIDSKRETAASNTAKENITSANTKPHFSSNSVENELNLKALEIKLARGLFGLDTLSNYSQTKMLKSNIPPQLSYSDLEQYPSKLRRAFYNFEIGFYAGPSLPSRTVSFSGDDEITRNNVANENLENTLSMGFQFSKRWRNIEYGLGFYYSEWNQTSNNIILESEPVTNTATNYSDKIRAITSIGDFTLIISNGAPIQPSIEAGQFLLLPNILQQYQFIDIPVSSSYYLLDRRFKLKLQLGLNNRFLNQSLVQLEYPDGSKEDFDDLKPETYSIQLISGLGLSYGFGNRWNLNVIPSYYYGLSPISIQSGAQTRQHQFTLFSGVSYRL